MKRMVNGSKKAAKGYYSVKIINKLPKAVEFRCEDKNFLFLRTFSIGSSRTVTKSIREDTFLAVWSGYELIGDYTLPFIDTEDSYISNLFRGNKNANSEVVLTITDSGVKIDM